MEHETNVSLVVSGTRTSVVGSGTFCSRNESRSDSSLVSFRMIPANHKYFVLSDLASSRYYELCVLAVYDDGITTLTGTKLVGCVTFTTESEYGRCHSIRDQVGPNATGTTQV